MSEEYRLCPEGVHKAKIVGMDVRTGSVSNRGIILLGLKIKGHIYRAAIPPIGNIGYLILFCKSNVIGRKVDVDVSIKKKGEFTINIIDPKWETLR